jgi:hypothetical protein
LKLRGGGDVLGTDNPACGLRGRAHRRPGQADQTARDDALVVLARDPALASTRGEALRHLLLSVQARRGDQADQTGEPRPTRACLVREQDCLVVACTVEHVDDMVWVDQRR